VGTWQLFASTLVPVPVHAGLLQVAVPLTVVGTHFWSGRPHCVSAVHRHPVSAALGVPVEQVQVGLRSEPLACTTPEHVPLPDVHVNFVSEQTYDGAHATVASF
jgi:hypothetical protein